ncbi:acyl carrier protein [Nitrogeniibacter mangrovi]|uniref:Acyl carrier protein n=1 Tax=Nitrogeniibacter mangrovi TaxID=2016596 RepID=A0A6C1B2P2_9RHOO|nr:acyl carrier protein [Nitrogeniibacter mangrovi]QID16474.1 acyl carrier protein [Nitrogeniibacter mangrovi]
MNSLDLIRDFAKNHGNIAPETVVPEATLADIGIDSLMLLELLFDFEEKTGITLPKDLPNPTTVQDLVTQLDRLGLQPTSGS